MAELIRLFGTDQGARPFLDVFEERAQELHWQYQKLERPDQNRSGILLHPQRNPLDVAKEITLLIHERIKTLGYVTGQHYSPEDVENFHRDPEVNLLYGIAHLRLSQDLLGASEKWCAAYRQMGIEALEQGVLRSPAQSAVSKDYYEDIIAFPQKSVEPGAFRKRCEALSQDIDQRHQILAQSVSSPAIPHDFIGCDPNR